MCILSQAPGPDSNNAIYVYLCTGLFYYLRSPTLPQPVDDHAHVLSINHTWDLAQ
jgi:hypothetical protein